VREHVFAVETANDSIVTGLNDRQREAACAPTDRPLLVIAGAGTGKTTTLVARVAWLIEQGVRPERILLLTFTRRAAREMLQRTRSLLGNTTAQSAQVVGGTFHSVAYRLLRQHAASLGLPSTFSVLDPSDVADLIDVVREELGLAGLGKRFPRKGTLADIYSRTVNAQRPLSDVVIESFPWCCEYINDIAEIFRALSERKRAAQALDFDDLLLYWRAALKHQLIGREMGRMFEHVLVDEYQDVNGLQVDILAALRTEKPGLTVVGDDLQAIYGFRAASADHLLTFPDRFPGTQTVTLERNYRSSQPILALGNAVAAQAERSYPRRLQTDREQGGQPELVFCLDEAEEAALVAERVLAHYEQGVRLRDQAVLMRTAHHSDLLELELTRRQIPYVKYGGIRYLDAAHVRDFLALIRIAANPADWVAWFRLLQLLDGIGPVSARKLLDHLLPDNTDTSIEPAWRRWPHAEHHLPESARAGASELITALEETAALSGAGLQADRLRIAIQPLIKARYPDSTARLLDLEQLSANATAFPTLEQFAAELTLDQPRSSADLAQPPHLDDDYLILSTIHSAKGLEWDVVHLIHLADGHIPSDMALSNKEGLAEEHRLLYVATTRPRNHLHLYTPHRYYHHPRANTDPHGLGKTTRFLTPDIQALCTHTRPTETSTNTELDIAASVTVSLDHLWH
jgi:DNA helicase-2/ATP-dependent DNA helicase PcrA